MSGDYINREAALKAIYTSTAPALEVKAMPAADVVEVRHAHWIVEDGCAYCSECRNNFKKAIMTHSKFCPMCGAKMDGTSTDYAPAKPYDLLYEDGGSDA